MFYTSSIHLRLFLLFRYIPCKFKFSLCKPEELYCLSCCLRNLCCISCDFPLSYPANNGDLSHVKIILHDILTCEDSCFRANVHVLFLWHLYNMLENKMWFENSANAWGNYRILYRKTNKEASTELCSVVKDREVGKNTRLRLVFSPTLLSCSTASCVLYNRTERYRGFFIC